MSITEKDVFLYFANQLNRARRMEIEAAFETDPNVQRWFEELGPTDEDIDRIVTDASAAVRSRSSLFRSVPAESVADKIVAWKPGQTTTISGSADEVLRQWRAYSWSATGGMRAAGDDQPAPLAAINANDVVEVRDARVFIEFPADEARLGVARLMVFHRLPTNDSELRLVGTCLIPLAQIKGVRVASEPIAAWVTGIPESEIYCQVVIAQPDSLKFFPEDEVETLLQDNRVTKNDSVKADVETLLRLIRTLQEGGQ